MLQGFLQFIVKRIRQNYFENIEMLKGGHPKALTTWEKRYTIYLVIVGGLEIVVQVTRDFKYEMRADNCIQRVNNGLKKQGQQQQKRFLSKCCL